MECYRFEVFQETMIDANNRIVQNGFFAALADDEFEEEDHPVQQLLDHLGHDAFFLLNNLVNSFYRKAGIIPWCVILLEKEYSIGKHIDSIRRMNSDILYSAWSYRNKGEHQGNEARPFASVIINPAIK